MSDVRPFTIDIPDAALEDLRGRLLNTRWPDEFGNEDWSYGANKGYLQEVVDYWVNEFDWRAQEREMNSFANFTTTIDEVPIHFIHELGKGPNPIPLLVLHGYPMTYWEMRKLIAPLTDPAAHGRDPAVSFDVIVPSLPGHIFSSPLRKTGVNFMTAADVFDVLMHDVLGYEKYAVHGGDWGSMIGQQLGHKHHEHLIGFNSTMTAQMGLWGGWAMPTEDDYEEDERHFTALNVSQGAEAASQTTGTYLLDPQTQAYGFHDSPVAQLAWMTEIRRAWSDCHGDIETRFSKDELITQTAHYWLTETFVTARHASTQKPHVTRGSHSMTRGRSCVRRQLSHCSRWRSMSCRRNGMRSTSTCTEFTACRRVGTSPHSRNRSCSSTRSAASSAPFRIAHERVCRHINHQGVRHV